MHIIQRTLLARLLKSPTLSYTDLTQDYTADNNVVFHLNKLIDAGYVEKTLDRYMLTADGIARNSKFDHDTLDEFAERQTIFGFLISYEEKYIMKFHEQAKKPFINLPSGVPYFGRSTRQELVRILTQMLPVSVQGQHFIFDSIHMKTIKNRVKKVIFDDTFLVYKIHLEQLPALPTYLKLMTKMEIQAYKNRWPEVDMCILGIDWSEYSEYEVVSEYIL